MKSNTDIKQSRKLAEILPHITADQTWRRFAIAGANLDVPEEKQYVHNGDMPFSLYSGIGLPCWSLSALLNYLRESDLFPKINADEYSVKMNICYYDNEEGRLHSIKIEADSFVDAAFEMIVKLHKLNLL